MEKVTAKKEKTRQLWLTLNRNYLKTRKLQKTKMGLGTQEIICLRYGYPSHG